MTQETEIKIRIDGIAPARERIERAGFRESRPRVFERNLVWDRADQALRVSRTLLRLREAGPIATLTFKGAPQIGRHKSREERETAVADPGEMRVILERLGYEVMFIYEKYRTEFQREGEAGTITLDETPIGNFLELEGEAEWIDRTADTLGYGAADYETGSYGILFQEWRDATGAAQAHMQF